MIASGVWQKIIVLCWSLMICHTVSRISRSDMICMLLKKTFEVYCWQIELRFYWESLLWVRRWERLLWVKLRKDFFSKILIEERKHDEDMWKDYSREVHWRREWELTWDFRFFNRARVSNALMHMIINLVVLFKDSTSDRVSNHLFARLMSSINFLWFVIRRFRLIFFNFISECQSDNIFIFRNTFRLNLDFFLSSTKLMIKERCFFIDAR